MYLLDTNVVSELMTRPGLKELLLTPEARTEELTPPRPEYRRRAPVSFE